MIAFSIFCWPVMVMALEAVQGSQSTGVPLQQRLTERDKMWNIFCGRPFEWSQQEAQAKLREIGSITMGEIRKHIDYFDQFNIETGNPADHWLDYRSDEMRWLKYDGYLPECIKECSPPGNMECIETLAVIYKKRLLFLDLADAEEQKLYVDSPQALLFILKDNREYREIEKTFLMGFYDRQRKFRGEL